MQNMVLISGAQLVSGEDAKFVVDDNVVKNVSNFVGINKACHSSSIVVNRNGKFDFWRGCACSSHKSFKESDQFVVRGFIIKITIEITETVFKEGIDKAVDWIFP